MTFTYCILVSVVTFLLIKFIAYFKNKYINNIFFLFYRDEAVLIKKIVQRVLRKLDDIHKDKARSKRVLIRLENQISHVESLLMADSKDVRAIGIWGMPGIGKTTIAEEVYNRQRSKYDACYFKAKVREEWRRHGSMNLKNELFSTLLGQQDLKIYTAHGLPDFVDQSWRFPRIKVLVVLDDVNDQQQLEILIGSTFDRFAHVSFHFIYFSSDFFSFFLNSHLLKKVISNCQFENNLSNCYHLKIMFKSWAPFKVIVFS
jgi:hypothetical protein